MRILIVLLLIATLLGTILLSIDFSGVARWAVEQQRAFQNDIAGAVRDLQSGAPGAIAALLAAAAAYGFVHAVGPGHGKYLIGGVGLGSSVSAGRLSGLALASSLAQAVWAIVLVYGGFFLLEVSARQMTVLAEEYLAPASYIAIASVGVVLVWRGARALSRQVAPRHRVAHAHAHAHGDCSCHSHGPSPEEAAKVSSWRDAMALIVSIAIRPCTGAIFLLVIAWQMDIQLAGALAVITMGLGTAALTSLVALSSVAARTMAFASADRMGAMALAFPSIQVLVGVLIIWTSLMLLGVLTG
ncbi:nickel/cobalt transporter [Aestuariibius sp. 2305UL40-4]|uniref:nickel/cobalt transporter n=1 Tax=Aestuariibius violaceus TaxID=3234132 RepID=UPI00345F03BC